MLSIAFAFVVATAAALLFSATRWLGVVGVVILLTLYPLFFGALLLAVAAAYVLLIRPGTYPVPRGLSQQSAKFRTMFAVALLVAAGGALSIVLDPSAAGQFTDKVVDTIRSAPSEETVVLRTPGGRLEVSEIHCTEILDVRIEHRVLGLRVGESVPRIRLPAVYRYTIQLDPEWRVLRTDRLFTVVVPAVQPSLPVAVDLAGIEKDVAGSWYVVPFTKTKDLDTLERGITAKLARKATSREYLERQRDDARTTVTEFVRKWLVEQTRWKDARFEDIRVVFADESTGAIAGIVR